MRSSILRPRSLFLIVHRSARSVAATPTTACRHCWSAARPSSSVGTPIARVSLTSPDIADALVTSPSELLVNGKMPGTISMFVWDRAGAIRRYEVIVQRDLARLAEQMQAAVPGETIDVQSNGKQHRAVRHGDQQGHHREGGQRGRRLRRQEGRGRDAAADAGRRPQQPGAAARALRRGQPQRDDRARRVALHGRRRLQEHIGRTTTQQFPAPTFDSSDPTQRRKLIFSDFLNLFLFNSKEQTRRRRQGAADERAVPEPGRAEPGGRERQGSELPRRRRVPGSDRAGHGRQHRRSPSVQGVRHPPELHADRQRRPRAPEGAAGSQHARLHQCRRAQRLPHPGADARAGPRPSSSCRTARRSRSPA